MPVTLVSRPARTPRPLTGRMVLLYLVAFFSVVFAANIIMARIAVSSFSGVETDSAYKAGLAFKNDVAAAQAQDARHWSVEAAVQRGAEATRIAISARDAENRAIAGLVPEIRLAHPTDRRHDLVLQAVEVAPGRFQCDAPVHRGQWDLVIGLRRGDETVFRSRSRIAL
ncbi:FixH family protein [Microvirga thermotolerans]|uniref:Nitrogen fixation protein FixH n=1 Tax=Microvirga thermotolerans TaxID=2651334 RepID=A0A5P9JVA3_9HYPH|nr:FixH family protein [Microvirga thermotolerans]QFU16109.1 nitrogen fixation protein FixH [Microvirga thermotolerans]